jgi:hypothetical protein
MWWLYAIAVLRLSARAGLHAAPGIQAVPLALASDIERCFGVIKALMAAEENSGYQVDRLLESANL